MQTSEGARKAWKRRMEKYSAEEIREMQSKGGRASTPGGFGTKKLGSDGLTGRERARLAAAKSHKVRGHNFAKDYERELEDL